MDHKTMVLRLGVALFAASLCAPAVGLELTPAISLSSLGENLQKSVVYGGRVIKNNIKNAKTYVIGPTPPMLSGYVDVGKSCNDLYTESLNLLPQTYDYAGGYWTDSRNQIGAVLGTIYTPMYAL
jgi:hypothetical protein